MVAPSFRLRHWEFSAIGKNGHPTYPGSAASKIVELVDEVGLVVVAAVQRKRRKGARMTVNMGKRMAEAQDTSQ